MDIRNNDIVTRIVVGIVCFAVFIVVLKLTSGPAPSEKKTVSNGEKKVSVGKRKETPEPEKKAKASTKAQAAPKDAVAAKASAAAAPAPVNAPAAPAPAPAKAPAAAAETKKSKETVEERESRKQRQEVAKAAAVAPAAAAPVKVSPKAAPAPEKPAPAAAAPKATEKAAPAASAKAEKAAPTATSKANAKTASAAPAAAPKPIVVPEEEWELVGDRRKQKPKKVVEESPKAATEEVAPLPKLQIVTETKTLTVDAKKVGALIGPKGVTLRHIQEVTSTLIQIPKSSTPKEGESAPDSAKIAVTGPAAGVAQAIKMLSDIAAGTPTVAPAAVVAPVTPTAEAASTQAAPAPAAPVVETVNSVVVVDTKKLGVVIGPKGATFKAIQEATSTIINTTSSKDSSSEKTSINVSGLADGVKKAVKAINELASKGYCALLAGENFQESFITVDAKFLPDIIGKAGSNIKAIQEHSGARVVVPSTPPVAPGAKDRGDSSTKITIAGPREGVALAKEIIKQITEVFHHPITHPGVVHNTVEVPERYYNVIIGAKGSEIRHIQNNFKVSVKIPNETTSFRDVMVLGQPGECEAAIRYIQKLVEKVQEKEQMRENEKFAGDEEESYDEELMNRYVYSRQNRNTDGEPATQQSSSPPRRTVSSERPPGFSPLNKADGEGSLPAVPMVWGSAAAPQSWGPVK